MPLSLPERARRFLLRRQTAYRQTFAPENQGSRIVLADLERFCRARVSTAHQNPYVAARLDGRREVILCTFDHLYLPNEELYRLYGALTTEE